MLMIQLPMLIHTMQEYVRSFLSLVLFLPTKLDPPNPYLALTDMLLYDQFRGLLVSQQAETQNIQPN